MDIKVGQVLEFVDPVVVEGKAIEPGTRARVGYILTEVLEPKLTLVLLGEEKPTTIVVYASGATSISSRCSMSLLEKNDETTFANEFVITAIMMRPGAMKVMYGTPSISPIRRPTRLPKMMK